MIESVLHKSLCYECGHPFSARSGNGIVPARMDHDHHVHPQTGDMVKITASVSGVVRSVTRGKVTVVTRNEP